MAAPALTAPSPKPSRKDRKAATKLKELRLAKGLILEDVPSAMRAKGIRFDYTPSYKTLWRIEKHDAEPSERFKFGLAEFYGVDYRSLWSR